MGELLIRETSFQRIMRKTGRKPVQCKCQLCKMQCHTPCLGTPEDIERIIDAGYSDKLAATYWVVGIVMRVIDFPVLMIQAVAGEDYSSFFLKRNIIPCTHDVENVCQTRRYNERSGLL